MTLFSPTIDCGRRGTQGLDELSSEDWIQRNFHAAAKVIAGEDTAIEQLTVASHHPTPFVNN